MPSREESKLSSSDSSSIISPSHLNKKRLNNVPKFNKKSFLLGINYSNSVSSKHEENFGMQYIKLMRGPMRKFSL